MERQQAELTRAWASAELWERRARRVDEIAHINNHVVAPYVMKNIIPADGLRPIPLLEDPL